LIEQSDHFVMRRNAIIALGNIGGEHTLRTLQSYGKDAPGDSPAGLAGYIESATARIAERMGRQSAEVKGAQGLRT
jgi:hypothetical protein